MRPTDQRHSCLETVVLSCSALVTVPQFNAPPRKKKPVYMSLRGGTSRGVQRKWLHNSEALRSKNDPDFISKGAEALLCPCIQVPWELPRNTAAEGPVDSHVDYDGISDPSGAATSYTITVSRHIIESPWGKKSLHWASSSQWPISWEEHRTEINNLVTFWDRDKTWPLIPWVYPSPCPCL